MGLPDRHRSFSFYNIVFWDNVSGNGIHMITSEMPYKLREIIMDTWPQLYWLKDAKDKDNLTSGEVDGKLEKNN